MLKMKRSVVVFDVDGTLVDSSALMARALMDALASEGVEGFHSEEDLRPYYGPDERGVLRKILGDAGKADRAFKVFLKSYRENHHDLMPHPIEGMPELLRSLRDRRTLRLGLVTGRSQESLDYTFEVFNLARFFESIHAGSPRGINKPESMKKLFADLGVNRNECLYVGDTIADVNSMRQVGVMCISTPLTRPQDIPELERINPGLVAATVPELERLLLANIR